MWIARVCLAGLTYELKVQRALPGGRCAQRWCWWGHSCPTAAVQQTLQGASLCSPSIHKTLLPFFGFFFFFLFSFFAEKWTQISRATATVWLIPSPFSQILRITSLFVISKTDLKGIVSVSRPYTFSYRNCGFIYLFFNKRKHGIKQTNKQTSSRQLHNLFGAKPRRFNHNCATIHRRDRKLETSQCPGQSPRHRGTPIGTPRAAFCSRGQAERVLSRAKAFSLSID